MYRFEINSISSDDRQLQFGVFREQQPVSFLEVVELWQFDDDFLGNYIHEINAIPFKAFRWETPGLTSKNANNHFKFVAIDDPWLDLPADGSVFREWFSQADGDELVSVFPNLGGDAKLIVPIPQTGQDRYSHFGQFHRNAPQLQMLELWRNVGRVVEENLGYNPIWLSSAGGGVPWLHIRLDTSPKYYRYTPYKTVST